MIKITNLSKRFGKLKALDKLNLEFKGGECVALIGPNGSGKTTLIKSILGMVVPDEGTILFNQQSILKDWKYRSQIGYMPQIGRYPDNMTIGQVIHMMKDIRKTEKQKLDEELIENFNLNSIMDKRMRTLSGGTRQKVSASLAFLFDADVLILDEPTAGLDPLSSEILKEKIIKEKSKGKLIIITSHVLSELDDIINQVVYMQDGKLKFQKEITLLEAETGEHKLSKAIAKTMLSTTKISD
jgi:Cu-processing system ATP-binding protein